MAYLERELNDADRQWMEQHRAGCARCEALVSDIDTIVASASALPAMTPSRDLWSGIAERLDAPVVPLFEPTPFDVNMQTRSRSSSSAQSTRRGMNVRWLAIAATVLIAVTSAVTWRIARVPQDASVVAASDARAADTVTDPVVVMPVANASDVYEQEIAAMRTIVNERFTELDSSTVAVIKRNLEIIDKAIDDSRAALAKDPNSRVLSTSLDRALEQKLALMRRLALL